MKRISFLTLFVITLIHYGFSQSYKEQLKKVNDFLKTFDNGYYGYLEIKDGYLYDRFSSGKYSRSEIKYLGKAYEEDLGKKVSVDCVDGRDCVFSTYTDSYHKSIGFSQTLSFKTSVLISLLDDLIDACKKSYGINNDKEDAEKRTPEREKPVNESTGNSSSVKINASGDYQTALKKLNDYLKTFDNGYYGYVEIINDELFIRLKTGFYCQAKINDLDKAYVVEANKKIEIRCLGGKNCMNATYTSGKTTGLKMYQDDNFDSAELIQLINDLISTLKKNNSNTFNSDSESKTAESEISKTNTGNSNNSTSGYSTSTGNYQTALKKLNDYLKTFDNGYYGYFEVKDGYIYDRFKAGKYNKFRMEDMEGAVIQEQYSRVIFKCKGDNKCITTDWKENGREEYTQFTKSGSFNYQELAGLLNDFRDAYLGKNAASNSFNSSSTSSKSITSGSYQASLKALNEYLITFDGDRYQGLEIKDGYLYSNYKNNNYSKAKIEDIEKVVLNKEYKYIKLACKNESQCVYSTITGGYHDYFNFQTGTGKDLNKLLGLLEDFLAALQGKPGVSKNNSDTKTEAQKIREQKDKERQQGGKLKETTQSEDDDDYFGFMYDTPTTNNKSAEQPKNTGTGTNTGTAKYANTLKALNDYLKTFNSETYKGVEVKNGKVNFKFYVYGAIYDSYIDISSLINNTIVTKGKSVGSFKEDEIKISCKSDSKCFYSEYSKGQSDHFRFFSRSVSDLTKMEQLVKDFIKSLAP